MRNIHLILTLLGLLTSTVAHSQLNYEFAFNKDTKVLTCEITNASSDSLAMLQKRSPESSGSFIAYQYYDSNNEQIIVIENLLTSISVIVFPPGMSVRYEYSLLNHQKSYTIENIHHFRTHGTIMYLNLKNKDWNNNPFEKTYQWE